MQGASLLLLFAIWSLTSWQGTATALKVSSIPTFHFSLGQTLMKTQVGASKQKLEENVKLLAGPSPFPFSLLPPAAHLAENDKEQLLKHVVESGEVAEGEAEKIGEVGQPVSPFLDWR